MVKILTEEEDRVIDKLILHNTIVSVCMGVGLGTLASMGLSRVWPAYGRLPLGIKGPLIMSGTVALMVVRTENQNILYERVLYKNGRHGASDESPEEAPKPKKVIAPGSGADRALSYFLENKYGILGTMWAAAAAGSVYKLYLNKHITWTQRLVQARMYAQALTIVGLLGVAAVSKLAHEDLHKTSGFSKSY
ncbi:Respiratory supercomplex factor 2-like protein [Smittium mucronatum]|uniref:Respiratory supercomplex factor 2-like protein n=1 Tax=Smittium mucronatum TaxID=133383 RepID=A0A1R0GLI5_9FUNG|nr:Respiratory supercomplex factor 2-like protein [Smittium mucronatum]